MTFSVALCTYNGEKYLQEQLGSIAAQSRLPDELVICDDRSNDGTIDILHEFEKSAPFAVRIFENEINLGPVNNFAKVVSLCQGKWVSLCDQDDHWLPTKLEISGQKMAQMEAIYGANTPLLVHTDGIVADADLNEIERSLWKLQHTCPEKGNRLAMLLSQNIATGCTVTINKSLCDKAFPLPEDAVMHDWWLALVASAFGRIGHISEPTILYRQHGQNDTGAKKWGPWIAIQMLLAFKGRASDKTRKQASEFLNHYKEDLSFRQKDTLAAFIELPHKSYFTRKHLILKYGLHYHGLLRNIGNLILK